MRVVDEAAGLDECAGCAGGDRREFLRDAVLTLAGALAGLGLAPERAHTFPVHSATPLFRTGDEITFPIPAQNGATINREHNVIVARYSGAVYAFSLACPHQRAALKWLGDQGRFQCPKHKSKYRPDGSYISGRATRSMDRFFIRRAGSNVVVDLSRLFREDRDQAAWSTALVRV